jgi:hypothetical protein
MAMQMTGILAGDGTAMVHAQVFRRPTPQQPPSALADAVEPVLDSDPHAGGVVRDWQLSMGRLLGRDNGAVHDIWSEFNAWRRQYVAERVLGDLATVRSFIAWADGVRDTHRIHPMLLPAAQVTTGDAAVIEGAMRDLLDKARHSGEPGLGVSVPQRAGLVRGFLLTEERPLLLGLGATQVWASSDGLLVTDGTGQPGLLIHGWELGPQDLTAFTTDGAVRLGGTDAARLLVLVAPGVAQASVGRASVASIFGMIIDGMREMAGLAAGEFLPLHLRRVDASRPRTGQPMTSARAAR